MPAAFTASAKFLRSLSKTAATCSLVWPPGRMPSAVRRAATSGVFTMVVTASRSFSMMGSGVPLGTRKPFQDANTKPGIVSVATGGEEYGSDHHLPAIQALKAGCDVLVEKPISNQIADAEAIVATAAKHGRRLGVNLNHRFTPLAETAKR